MLTECIRFLYERHHVSRILCPGCAWLYTTLFMKSDVCVQNFCQKIVVYLYIKKKNKKKQILINSFCFLICTLLSFVNILKIFFFYFISFLTIMANICNGILWFLILYFISLWVASICFTFYIIVSILLVCIPPLEVSKFFFVNFLWSIS